jgi:hypothetical protein
VSRCRRPPCSAHLPGSAGAAGGAETRTLRWRLAGHKKPEGLDVLRSSVVAQLVDQVVEPGRDARTGPVYGTDSDRLVGAGRGTLFMLREHLRTSIMGGRCDRPNAAACDYRLTYRSSQMVRTGAAKTKQCCEHMISATTTRELPTGLDESAGKAHIA